MKTYFKFFAILLLVSFTLSAAAQVSIGPKFGLNMATWVGEDIEIDDDNLKYEPMLQFGAVAEFRVSDRLAIQPELLYFQKGVGVEGELLETTFSSRSVLNYIEVPVLVKVNLTTGPVQVFVTAGPSVGYGLDGKTTVEAKGEKEEMDIDFEDDEINRFDFSAAMGAGVQFNVGPGQVFVDGRFLLGLNTLDASEPKADRMDMRNQGIGIAAGFLFPLSR